MPLNEVPYVAQESSPVRECVRSSSQQHAYARAVGLAFQNSEVAMRILLAVLSSAFVLSIYTAPALAAAEPQVFDTSAGPVKITPLNHASTLIEAAGKEIYLDPAKPVKFSGLPKADLILITDIHGDHMDPDSIKEISKAGTEIISSPAVAQTVTSATPIANGETKTWQNWTIEAIPAYNLKRGPAPGKLFHDKGRG